VMSRPSGIEEEGGRDAKMRVLGGVVWRVMPRSFPVACRQ
jgi:hypothetical protein